MTNLHQAGKIHNLHPYSVAFLVCIRLPSSVSGGTTIRWDYYPVGLLSGGTTIRLDYYPVGLLSGGTTIRRGRCNRLFFFCYQNYLREMLNVCSTLRTCHLNVPEGQTITKWDLCFFHNFFKQGIFEQTRAYNAS